MTKDLTGAAVLFDLDGTLIDTAADLAAAMNDALAKEGLRPVGSSQVRHLVGHGARRMLIRGFEITAGRAASAAELDRALANFLTHYEAKIAVHSKPFDGVIPLIKSLISDGAKMAICTNKRERLARLLIEKLGLSSLFETIVGADTAAAPKPDPAPVRLCLERLKADRGVYFGDSDTDIKAAGAAGLPSLIADFGYGPLTLAHEATALFSRYGEAERLARDAL